MSERIEGDLTHVSRPATGSTGGKWFSDAHGVVWFVKKDVIYQELQTSAEVISSQIYQFFGFKTPETIKFVRDGVFYSGSKDIGKSFPTDLSDMNSSEVRQMRVIAAYLKDWDRLGNPENNREMADGSLIILNFGGSLGARAQGMHKPGVVVSEAIGSFESTSDINVIYSAFKINSFESHPWMKINRADAEAVVKNFKLLTDKKIESIVDSAKYSRQSDRDYMVQALKIRRDGIVSNLMDIF